MRRNRNRTETERRAENVHEFDFIFFGFGGRISAKTTCNFDKICTYTTTCVVYNLVIMKTIDGLSSETIVRLFYEHNTINYIFLWDNSSIGATIESMTSRRQIQDGGPHDFRSKMAALTTSGPRWRPPRHQDGGPTKSDTRWRPL